MTRDSDCPLWRVWPPGVAVIVSSVPALLEVTGGHASVFDIGDVDGLAAALAESADRESVGADAVDGAEPAAARRAYARQWTWRRCAQATVAGYRLAAG